MDFKGVMLSVILLFILTVFFYSGDPIYTGFLARWTEIMMDDGDTFVYDATLRNWRLTVPAFIFVIGMLVLKSIKKPKYGGMV